MVVLRSHGWFDGVEQELAYGWASPGLKDSEFSAVDVLIDGRFIKTIVADEFRSDLKESGIREGRAGFSCEIPGSYRDGAPHLVEVRHHGTDQPLANSPQTFSLKPDVPTLLVDSRRATLPSDLILQDGTQSEEFENRLRLMRKVAIISTYHDAGSFLAYHEVLFRALSENGFITIVVHASGSAKCTVVAPQTAGCYVIVKRNVGYDFGSWAVAVDRLRPQIDLIDEMVLLNDSVIPLDVPSLSALLERVRTAGSDVVGLTESYEHIYHLQSYFLWLNTPALRSAAFHNFMLAYSFSSVKAVVIAEGELALTKCFMDAGYSVRALFAYDEVATLWLQNARYLMAEIEDLPAFASGASSEDYRRTLIRQLENVTGKLVDGQPMNPSHFFWDTLIEQCRFPFLKRELALVNPCNVPTYYRIGRVLQTRTEARKAIMEIRRVYGGNLLPTFMPQPSAQSSLPPIVPARSQLPAYLSVVR